LRNGESAVRPPLRAGATAVRSPALAAGLTARPAGVLREPAVAAAAVVPEAAADEGASAAAAGRVLAVVLVRLFGAFSADLDCLDRVLPVICFAVEGGGVVCFVLAGRAALGAAAVGLAFDFAFGFAFGWAFGFAAGFGRAVVFTLLPAFALAAALGVDITRPLAAVFDRAVVERFGCVVRTALALGAAFDFALVVEPRLLRGDTAIAGL
jgi:hypothetical protein